MHDALTLVLDFEFKNAELVAVLVEGFHLNTGNRIDDAFHAASPVRRRHVVVRCCQVGVQPPGFTTGQAQALESLW